MAASATPTSKRRNDLAAAVEQAAEPASLDEKVAKPRTRRRHREFIGLERHEMPKLRPVDIEIVLNVSEVTCWRYRKLPGFPKPDGLGRYDREAVLRWAESAFHHAPERNRELAHGHIPARTAARSAQGEDGDGCARGRGMKPADPPGRDVPAVYQGIAAAAVRSRAAAVKLFCLECCGYVRRGVANCTATRCPLYRWRPYQYGDDDNEGSQTPEISAVTVLEATQAGLDLLHTLPAPKRSKNTRRSEISATGPTAGGPA